MKKAEGKRKDDVPGRLVAPIPDIGGTKEEEAVRAVRKVLDEQEKKAKGKSNKSEMRDEYDFSGGVRGKYAKRFAEGTNVVVLDPDIARLFGTSDAVNRALRSMAELARRQLIPGRK